MTTTQKTIKSRDEDSIAAGLSANHPNAVILYRRDGGDVGDSAPDDWYLFRDGRFIAITNEWADELQNEPHFVISWFSGHISGNTYILHEVA